MKLTPENKQKIDEMPYIDLLRKWRFKPVEYEWFQGETGKYWLERMHYFRNQPGGKENHARISKIIGW